MGWIVALLVLALVLGVIGLVVTAVKWLLILAGVLIVVAVLKAVLSRQT